MNDITYAVSVDVNNPIIPYNVYVANVLDSNVRYLEITLYQNGNVIALSNEATATASLVTDDVLIDDSVECTISNNIITVPLEDLQRHGNLGVQVTVTEDTKVLAIPFPIQVRVTPNIAEEAQIDDDSLGSYAEVVREIAAARGDYPDLKGRIDHTGAPTDEQVATAVSDWLDDHPEATTGFVTPEMYGAKGDGVTDDKSAIEAMLADIPDNALCVFYGNYYISAGITITRPVNITMYGKIVVAPTADFCMRISGHDVRKNTFRLNLETTSISGQWDGTYHTIGLDLYSTWENTVDVNVCNFNVGVRLISDNRDCTYNKIFIRYIFNCKTAILLTGDSTLLGGTTAQNTFVGGRVGASGDCLNYLDDSDTEDCYFPLNSELVGGRTNNNNNFVSVSFECGFAKDIEGKTNRAKINANYNYGTMIGCRFEGVTSFYGSHYISLVGGYGFDNIPNKSGGYSAIGVNDVHVNGYTAPIKIARNGNGGNIVEAINANGNKVWSLDSNGYSTNRAILLSPNGQTIIFPTSFMKIRGVSANNPTAALTALSNFEWGLSNYGFLVLKNSTGMGFIVQPIYTSAPSNPVAGTHALIDGKPMWFNGDEWVYANGDTAFSIPTIVSGVVNQNGTITFTDSDGNTFTTSGSSVIGTDGFSPVATVTQTQSGATVSITDKNGTTTANISNGADGQDYVLTSQDKTDIANIVLQLLPTTQGVLYGNTSN